MYLKFFIFIYIVFCIIFFIWLENKASEDESPNKLTWGDIFKILLRTLVVGFFATALISAILYPIFAGVFCVDY
jgi:uncharacterized membrane protein (DUF106 family)